MEKLLRKLGSVPLGGWLVIAFLLAAGLSLALKNQSEAVRNGLLAMRNPRLDPAAQALLTIAEPVPQVFTRTSDPVAARKLVEEIDRADVEGKAHAFHTIDLAFMLAYGALLVTASLWARVRGEILGRQAALQQQNCVRRRAGIICGLARALAGALRWLWPIGVAAAVVTVVGDVMEHYACTRILRGVVTAELLHLAAVSWWMKWIGAVVALLVGVLGGLASLLARDTRAALCRTWELLIRANHFAMKARFSVLAAALFTILLLTGPGMDIIRTVSTGAFVRETMSSDPQPDFARIGWFVVALLVLSGTCWGWARLVLALRFTEQDSSPTEEEIEGEEVEARLRYDLPIYFGAIPFVAAAGAFAIAPLQEAGSLDFPVARFLAASLAPLIIFFILPLCLVVFRASSAVPRGSFGPLSISLAIYAALALWHAIANRDQLGVLGVVPVVLLVTALSVFGLGRPSGILILPVALILSSVAFGIWARKNEAMPETTLDYFLGALGPSLVLLALGGVACCVAKNVRGADALYIPLKFSTGDLVTLTLSDAKRHEFRHEVLRTASARKELMRQHAAVVKTAPPSEEAASAMAVDRLRGLLQMCAGFLLLQIVCFLLVLWVPAFSRQVGSAAMLALGLAGWATVGSLLLFLTQASRFPILSVAILAGIVFSGMMDNHDVRISGPAAPAFVQARLKGQDTTDPIGEAFDDWQRRVGEDAPYCIIVAAEGGGIRAAMWPAIVLGTLQDRSNAMRGNRPDFASHVFAISGVSGGSVGAAVFTAVCADKRETGNVRDFSAQLCGQDHLAPTLGGLLYPDALQRLLPVAIFRDRATYFERSWEDALIAEPDHRQTRTRLGRPFTELWNSPDVRWLPALFLNSTMAENGKRAILSNLPVRTAGGGQFVDAHDLHVHLRKYGVGSGDWQDVSLSTAAHTSARFPLVSPPGRLPSGARVVDGGYFENSAATTGLDVLNAVTKRIDQIKADTAHPRKTPEIIFIFLRYAAVPGLMDSAPDPSLANAPSPSMPADDPNLFPSTNLLNESDGIVGTVLRTRDARGSYAQDAVFNRYFAQGGITVLSFTFRGEHIPLSWSLSQRSCNEMLRQFPKSSASVAEALTKADPPLQTIIRSNESAASDILNRLYGK